MFEHYRTVIRQVDDLLDLLKSIEIEAELSSHLENDYLAAHEFFDSYLKSPYSSNTHEAGRVALGGLHELYKWVWAVKDSCEFQKVRAHLGLLVQAAPKINAATPMINPASGKQDDKSNKFIEAIVGLFAIAYGRCVDLDDPVESSGGENPDAIFTFDQERVSVACKTLRSKNPQTILGNIRSGSRQITRADCERGYVLLNSMNILEHDRVRSEIFGSYEEPLAILREVLDDTYAELLDSSADELAEIFEANPKVFPGVVTTLHSATRVHSPFGVLSTSLKSTLVTNFNQKTQLDECGLKIPRAFNEFIHNRDLNA